LSGRTGILASQIRKKMTGWKACPGSFYILETFYLLGQRSVASPPRSGETVEPAFQPISDSLERLSYCHHRGSLFF
jgi:hypothetical protein